MERNDEPEIPSAFAEDNGGIDWGKLQRLLTSRKFIASVAAVLLALFGLDISPELQAAVVGLITAVFIFSTALEDGLSNRNNPVHITSILDTMLDDDEDSTGVW